MKMTKITLKSPRNPVDELSVSAQAKQLEEYLDTCKLWKLNF